MSATTRATPTLRRAKRLAEVVGTRVIDETESGELTATMVCRAPLLPSPFLGPPPDKHLRAPLPVERPDPAARGEDAREVYKSREQLYEIDAFLRQKLLGEWKTYAAHYFHAGAWWTRCSAQVFNEVRSWLWLGTVVE